MNSPSFPPATTGSSITSRYSSTRGEIRFLILLTTPHSLHFLTSFQFPFLLSFSICAPQALTMVLARSPSSSKSSNQNPSRKAVAFNLSKSWSGSEFPQRNTVPKSACPIPSPPAFFEQKENEGEPSCSRRVKTRPSKGMKSFMAPTISASSKITAASPRKKIYAERNQVVLESSECSIVLAEEVKQEEEIGRKSEISIGSEEISGQKMSRKLDFIGSKDHHQPLVTHSHDSGALEDDLSLPPYDPMKNYLAPRPQFLYYKPNQKIEQKDLLYAGDERRLHDSFSDLDDSGNPADCSGKFEDDETLMMAQEDQLSLGTHVSKPKPRSVGRSKLIPFLLILTVMSFFIPIIDSPLLTPLKTKDQSLVGPHTLQPFRALQDIHLYGYLDVASRNLQGLATRMRQWPKNYTETFSSFGSFDGPHTLLPLSFLQDIHFYGYFDAANRNLQCLATRMWQWPKNYTETFRSFGSFVGPHTLLPFRILQDIHFYGYLDVANRNLQGLATRMRQWPKNFIGIFCSFGSFSIELDLSRSINTTISSSSMVQNTYLDFCYKSGFKHAGKKNLIIEQDDVDSLELSFNNGSAERVIVDFSDEEALADDRDVVRKINAEFFGEDDNFPILEKRLILFTDPIAKFETFSKIEQPVKIEIEKFEEVYGGVYPVGFYVEALVKEGIDSSAYPLIELQMAHMKDFGDFLLNFLTELQLFIHSGENLVLAVLGMFSAASIVYLFIKPKQTVPSTGKKSRCKKAKLAPGATNSCKHGANRGFNSCGGLPELVSYFIPTEMSFTFKNSLHWKEMRGHPEIARPKIAQRRERRSRSARKGSKEEEVMAPVRRSTRFWNQGSSL